MKNLFKLTSSGCALTKEKLCLWKAGSSELCHGSDVLIHHSPIFYMVIKAQNVKVGVKRRQKSNTNIFTPTSLRLLVWMQMTLSSTVAGRWALSFGLANFVVSYSVQKRCGARSGIFCLRFSASSPCWSRLYFALGQLALSCVLV